jgi:hypothetical protein
MLRIIATTAPANLTAAPLGTGLAAGTMVETAAGWRDVARLRIGDRVQTFDGGLRPVLAVDRATLVPQPDLHLVHVPGGVLGTCGDLAVPSRQLVMLEADDPALPDAALVLLPALALVGWQGVTKAPLKAPVEVITPVFAAEEIVWANTGALLRCPGIAEGANGAVQSDFTRLDLQAAWAFLRRADAAARAA